MVRILITITIIMVVVLSVRWLRRRIQADPVQPGQEPFEPIAWFFRKGDHITEAHLRAAMSEIDFWEVKLGALEIHARDCDLCREQHIQTLLSIRQMHTRIPLSLGSRYP